MDKIKQKQAQQIINGTEYTFQKLPVMAAFELREQFMTEHMGINRKKAYPLILEHIVVHPKKKMEDFEDISELDDVVTAAINFQYGGK